MKKFYNLESWKNTFLYNYQMYEFFFSQYCSYILHHLVINFKYFYLYFILPPLYSLFPRFIFSILASGDFRCLLSPDLDTDRLPI